MNISIPLFLVFLLCSGAAFIRSRASVYFLFPIALLAFPTVRGQLGFPLYLFDVLGVLMLIHAFNQKSGPVLRRVTPWHWITFACLIWSGFLVSTGRYGFNAPGLWVTGHAAIAFLQFKTGLQFTQRNFQREKTYFVAGTIAGLGILAAIAWLQFGNAGFSSAFNSIFFRDTGRSLITSAFGAELTASRAGGPFSWSNTLGAVALCAGFTAWILDRGRLGIIALGLGFAAAVPTISRQVYIAAGIALGIYLILASHRSRFAGLIVLMLAPFSLPLLATFSAGAAALDRFSRWQGGALGDSNIYARLVVGPQRLWNLIEQHPDTLFFGAGWDVTKLSAQGVDTGDYASGFVSNGYLLWLYYGGVLSFFVILTFMGSLLKQSWASSGVERARYVAVTAAFAFLYLSDNTGAVVEAMICYISIASAFILTRAAEQRAPATSPVRRFARQTKPARMPAVTDSTAG